MHDRWASNIIAEKEAYQYHRLCFQHVLRAAMYSVCMYIHNHTEKSLIRRPWQDFNALFNRSSQSNTISKYRSITSVTQLEPGVSTFKSFNPRNPFSRRLASLLLLGLGYSPTVLKFVWVIPFLIFVYRLFKRLFLLLGCQPLGPEKT